MNNRYIELTALEQDTVDKLVNTIASCGGLLDSDRTVADIKTLRLDLQDRSRLQAWMNLDEAEVNNVTTVHVDGSDTMTDMRRKMHYAGWSDQDINDWFDAADEA